MNETVFIDFLNQYANIIQIIISILSLIATIFVSFFIYWLQRHHEKEMENLKIQQQENELKNQANQFLIDNADEIDYLPLCVISSSLHRHDKHCRKIYTNFCRCSVELQEKILNMQNFSFHVIPNKDWVYQAFEELRAEIEKHKLGRDILYDGAKYFHRGFSRYGESEWDGSIEYQKAFSPIAAPLGTASFFGIKMDDFGEYVEEYFHFLYSEYRPLLLTNDPLPPIDYLCQVMKFDKAEESNICAWTLLMVKMVSILIHNITYTEKKTNAPELDYTDAEIETFEDAYYDALRSVYNTYYCAAEK